MSLHRRGFLGAAAATVAGAAVAGFTTATEKNPTSTSPGASPASRTIPFHGPHQAGILTDRQDAAAFVAFDVTAATRGELADLLHDLTDRARRLAAGGTPPEEGISAPPADSGLLGVPIPAGGLTVTVSVGASLFDDRYGLTAKRPKQQRQMDTFPDDDLDVARCDGDLLLSICADQRDVVLHALRDITRHTRGGMQPRWRVDGFAGPPRPAGTPRNLLGFRDGTANPDVHDPREMDKLIWVQAGGNEPAWAVGGSYHVIRVIRMLVEFWDRVTLSEQERMIGRRRDSGAPLSGNVETDIPQYGNDANGATIPLDAHIRLANPRTQATDANRILRRGYNYDAGIDINGNLDMGLVFNAFQQDLGRQFVTVQKRLAGEPLVDYISPVGGGYFFALPGLPSVGSSYADRLLA
jgi:deferrochelatase/peroxidase EfeB